MRPNARGSSETPSSPKSEYAGSDLRLFMEFKKVFGPTSENLLTKTFRCPQGISDVAAAFIQKNKGGQKTKRVDSELDKRVDGVVDLHDVQQERCRGRWTSSSPSLPPSI